MPSRFCIGSDAAAPPHLALGLPIQPDGAVATGAGRRATPAGHGARPPRLRPTRAQSHAPALLPRPLRSRGRGDERARGSAAPSRWPVVTAGGVRLALLRAQAGEAEHERGARVHLARAARPCSGETGREVAGRRDAGRRTRAASSGRSGVSERSGGSGGRGGRWWRPRWRRRTGAVRRAAGAEMGRGREQSPACQRGSVGRGLLTRGLALCYDRVWRRQLWRGA